MQDVDEFAWRLYFSCRRYYTFVKAFCGREVVGRSCKPFRELHQVKELLDAEGDGWKYNYEFLEVMSAVNAKATDFENDIAGVKGCVRFSIFCKCFKS